MSEENKGVEVSPQVMTLLYENAKTAADSTKKALDYTELVLRQTVEQSRAQAAEITKLKEDVKKLGEDDFVRLDDIFSNK